MVTIIIPEWLIGLAIAMWLISQILRLCLMWFTKKLDKTVAEARASIKY